MSTIDQSQLVERYNEMVKEIARLRAATPLCDKHSPTGTRGMCVICAGERLQAALSRIDYLCGEPNEYGVSGYDVHANEEAVVAHVKARLDKADAEIARLRAELAKWEQYGDAHERERIVELTGEIDFLKRELDKAEAVVRAAESMLTELHYNCGCDPDCEATRHAPLAAYHSK